MQGACLFASNPGLTRDPPFFLFGAEVRGDGGWMRKVVRVRPRGKRLKGLDEYEAPAFVRRMARIERRRKLAWYAMLAGAVAVGVGTGLVLF